MSIDKVRILLAIFFQILKKQNLF